MGKFTARDIKITKDTVIATGEPFLSVTANIYEGEELHSQKKYGFAFGTPSESIVAEIKKSLTTMRSEIEQAEKNKDREALEEKADKAIQEISGLEIEEPENK